MEHFSASNKRDPRCRHFTNDNSVGYFETVLGLRFMKMTNANAGGGRFPEGGGAQAPSEQGGFPQEPAELTEDSRVVCFAGSCAV